MSNQGRQLLDLGPDDCRYPINDSSPYLFCGDRAATGSSYCELHHIICTKAPEHGLRGRHSPQFAAVMRKNNVPKCLVVDDAEELL